MTRLERQFRAAKYEHPMNRVELYLNPNEAELLLEWFRRCCLIGTKDLEPVDYRLAVKIRDAKKNAETEELEFA